MNDLALLRAGKESIRSGVANALEVLNAPHEPDPTDPLMVMVPAADLDRMRILLTDAIRQMDAK